MNQENAMPTASEKRSLFLIYLLAMLPVFILLPIGLNRFWVGDERSMQLIACYCFVHIGICVLLFRLNRRFLVRISPNPANFSITETSMLGLMIMNSGMALQVVLPHVPSVYVIPLEFSLFVAFFVGLPVLMVRLIWIIARTDLKRIQRKRQPSEEWAVFEDSR